MTVLPLPCYQSRRNQRLMSGKPLQADSFMPPLEIIRAAIKAVPAVKYALGVAGIVAVVAIIYSFGIGLWVAFIGALVVMVLMVVLVIFAKLTTTAPRHFLTPVLVLTWAFLLLTIAAAMFLFTSVFFRKPLDLINLLRPRPVQTTNGPPDAASLPNISTSTFTGPLAQTNTFTDKPETNNTPIHVETNAPVAETSPDSQTLELLRAVQLQQDAGDFAGAWKLMENVAAAAGNSEAVRAARLQLAEAWLRDARTKTETFSTIVDQVSGVISRGAASANKVIAADALAHLGWGNFLKSRDGFMGFQIDELYDKALKLDPQNVYAHTMLAHRILWQNGSEKDALAHFEKALQSGRDRAFVRRFQIAALINTHDEKKEIQLIRVVDEMRKNGESPDKDNWSRIASRVYASMTPATLEQTTRFISAGDHLATYHWLIEKVSEPNLIQRFIVARLTEMSGDTKGALSLYQQMKAESDFKSFRMASDVLNGIARCQRAQGGK